MFLFHSQCRKTIVNGTKSTAMTYHRLRGEVRRWSEGVSVGRIIPGTSSKWEVLSIKKKLIKDQKLFCFLSTVCAANSEDNIDDKIFLIPR